MKFERQIMLSRRSILGLLLFAFTVTFFSSVPSTATPIPSDGIRLEARMRAGIIKARARYEEINNNSRRKFNFQLENGTPGDSVSVSANGMVMGTAIVNNLRRAKFELDTNLGQTVIQLPVGTRVEVMINGTPVMSGTLQ